MLLTLLCASLAALPQDSGVLLVRVLDVSGRGPFYRTRTPTITAAARRTPAR